MPLLAVAFVVERLLAVVRLDEVLHRHRLVVEHNIQIPVVLEQHPRHILAGLQVHRILAVPPLHTLEEPQFHHIPEELPAFLTEMSEFTGISRCMVVPSVPTTLAVRFMEDPAGIMPK